MCGIAGLFLKNRALEPELGALTAAMLTVLTDRGPDSAGFAIYGDGVPGHLKLTLRAPANFDFASLAAKLGVTCTLHDDHAVFGFPAEREVPVRAALAATPEVAIVASGTRMELFKGVGLPQDVSNRFGLAKMSGSHAIGHTRMATESAVTTEHSHPFTAASDMCLVHNGSLSNHNNLRKWLRRRGHDFETDNDSEVAARYFAHRLGEGASLPEALEAGLRDLDGFFTFTMGTRDGFAVLRDGIACKPAVLAETEDWVAMASEFRSLANLPGVEKATIWEPKPAVVYTWSLQ
jgi:methylamine---glutamate N-methyltransferase subunit A